MCRSAPGLSHLRAYAVARSLFAPVDLPLLEYVQQRGEAHPREVDALFESGTVENAWGDSSKATTRAGADASCVESRAGA